MHSRNSKEPRPAHQARLFLLLRTVIFFFFPSLHAQFIPSQYSDVRNNHNYEFTLIRDEPFGIFIGATVLATSNSTLHILRVFLNDQEVLTHRSQDPATGSGRLSLSVGRLVEGALPAGTKIRVRGSMEAPGDPTARLFAVAASSVSYDATNNITTLERSVQGLEIAFQNRVNQNADGIRKMTQQTESLKTQLNDFLQRFNTLHLQQNQFKENTALHLNSINQRILAVENNLKDLSKHLQASKAEGDQWKTQASSRFQAVDDRFSGLNAEVSSLRDFNDKNDQWKTQASSRFQALDDRFSGLNAEVSSLKDLNDKNDQWKTQASSRFQAFDDRFSELEAKVSSLPDYYKIHANKEIANLNNRLTLLEKHPPSSSRGFFNNSLGIVGASLGGTAVLLTGAALYQTHTLKNKERDHSLKESAARGKDIKRPYSEARIKSKGLVFGVPITENSSGPK